MRVLRIALVAHRRRHRRYPDLAIADLEILRLTADRLGRLDHSFGRFHLSLRRNCSVFLVIWQTSLGRSWSTAEMRVKSCPSATISSQSRVHNAVVFRHPQIGNVW